MHIATQGEMDSAAAVVQGLLAFASLHRHGLQSQTVELKTAAVGYHSKALGTATSDAEAIAQHIATGMLLCSCEVLQASFLFLHVFETSKNCYFREIKASTRGRNN